MYVPYESLVLLGDGYEIIPNLATEWVEEPMALTLTLRDDVVFHDGTPFNAEAVKANLEYVRDNPGAYSGPLQAVASVDVVDEFTAKISFKFPAPSFLTMLTRNNVHIASPAALADGSVVTAPVGTGPWKFDAESSVEGTKWFFTLHEEYWGDPVYFENVELYGIQDDTAAVGGLLNGEIDVTDVESDQIPRIESADNIDSYEYPLSATTSCSSTERQEACSATSTSARRCATRRPRTECWRSVRDILEAPKQHFLEGDPGYNPDIIGYTLDLDEAESLLDGGTVEAVFPAAPFLKVQLEYWRT